MAALTTQQKYDAIREALDAFDTGAKTVSVSMGDISTTYNSGDYKMLQDREAILAARLTQRNLRKRVAPDFS